MKKTLVRESARTLKTNPYQPKPVQSQSPPHKKLLKKIEATQQNTNNHKFEYSLQENFIKPEPKEEVQDFRVEIERRFQKSTSNKTYLFPRNGELEEESMNDENSSNNTSMESLKYVTVYDLSSQNKKVKATYFKVMGKTNGVQNHNQSNQNSDKKRTANANDKDQESSDTEDESEPIEVRIRDKSSRTYKKIMYLLECHFSKPAQTNFSANKQQTKFEPLKMDNNINIKNNTDSHQSNGHLEILKFPEQKTGTSSKDKSPLLRALPKESVSVTALKKTFSQDKVRIQVDTNSFTDKSLNHTSHSSTKGTIVDNSRVNQETLKRLYANNLMKSITPQYASSKSNLLTSKEGFLKSYNNDNYPTQSHQGKVTSNVLYQKAKNEVMNHKLRLNKPGKPLSNSSLNSMVVPTKRDDSPNARDELKKIALTNIYSPTEANTDKQYYGTFSVSHSKLSKKNSVKTLQIISPPKKIVTEKPVQMTQSVSQEKFFKKPLFKLDLSKRTPTNRDALTSSRNRNKTADKITDALNPDSVVRMSYDNPQYSMFLNNTSNRNTSKKTIGFANAYKSPSLSKANFTAKQ